MNKAEAIGAILLGLLLLGLGWPMVQFESQKYVPLLGMTTGLVLLLLGAARLILHRRY